MGSGWMIQRQIFPTLPPRRGWPAMCRLHVTQLILPRRAERDLAFLALPSLAVDVV